MNRRTLTRVSVVLLVVIVASLSTIRVRQAWGQQQAHSGFVTARADASIALSDAAALGLLTSEIKPLKAQKARIDGAVAPSTSILWGSQESFFDVQAARYRSLVARIHARIVAVTRMTRHEASNSLAGLASELSRASSYGVDVPQASTQLARERALYSGAATARQYRAIAAAAQSATTPLSRSTDARAAEVKAIVSGAGNSLQSIQQKADSAAGSVQSQLSLISLFSAQGKRLASQISSESSAIHAQRTPFAAAVKDAALNDLVSQVAPLMKTAVPAKVILVSTENQWAYAYQNGQQVYDTPVTTGGPELPTDHGVFHIYAKFSPFVFHSPWPPGSPYYYPPTPITYWMPFDGAEGLHDASWRSNFGPGSNFQPTDLGTGNYILGTHGCVNLPYAAAAWVWDWAPVGTTVVVV